MILARKKVMDFEIFSIEKSWKSHGISFLDDAGNLLYLLSAFIFLGLFIITI